METNFSKEQWDAKVIDLGGSILQSWIWGELQQTLGLKIHRFSGTNYVNLVIETPLPFGKKYLYSAKGPLGDVDAAMADLKNYSTDKQMVFARIEPAALVNLPRAVKDTQPTHNWLVDLTKTEEELLASMKQKHRYNVNLAAKKGVVVREGNKQDILEVWKLLLETATRNGFRLHPQNYYWQMFDVLAPDNLKIIVAEHEGHVLAGMLLTCFGDSAIYLHGGTSNKMREVMAPYAMHWEAIKLAKSLGLKTYDFGGVAPDNEPNHEWAGISRFKKGFGGFELTTPGAFDLIYSPIWYNVYKNARAFSKILRRS